MPSGAAALVGVTDPPSRDVGQAERDLQITPPPATASKRRPGGQLTAAGSGTIAKGSRRSARRDDNRAP